MVSVTHIKCFKEHQKLATLGFYSWNRDLTRKGVMEGEQCWDERYISATSFFFFFSCFSKKWKMLIDETEIKLKFAEWLTYCHLDLVCYTNSPHADSLMKWIWCRHSSWYRTVYTILLAARPTSHVSFLWLVVYPSSGIQWQFFCVHWYISLEI